MKDPKREKVRRQVCKKKNCKKQKSYCSKDQKERSYNIEAYGVGQHA